MKIQHTMKCEVIIWFFVVSLSNSTIIAGGAKDSASLEYQIKAGFICKFVKFITWPPEMFPEPQTPIRIGILGQDPFGAIIDKTIKGLKVKKRKFVIERCNNISEMGYYHILFICRSEENRLSEIFSQIGRLPTLTISEMDRFCERGGIINFTISGTKVRFEANVQASKAIDLEISTRLLGIAKIVPSKPNFREF